MSRISNLPTFERKPQAVLDGLMEHKRLYRLSIVYTVFCVLFALGIVVVLMVGEHKQDNWEGDVSLILLILGITLGIGGLNKIFSVLGDFKFFYASATPLYSFGPEVVTKRDWVELEKDSRSPWAVTRARSFVSLHIILLKYHIHHRPMRVLNLIQNIPLSELKTYELWWKDSEAVVVFKELASKLSELQHHEAAAILLSFVREVNENKTLSPIDVHEYFKSIGIAIKLGTGHSTYEKIH